MTIFTWLFIFIGLYLYFIPTRTAYVRKNKNKQSVLVLNLFFGWTLLGWVVALAIAVSGNQQEA